MKLKITRKKIAIAASIAIYAVIAAVTAAICAVRYDDTGRDIVGGSKTAYTADAHAGAEAEADDALTAETESMTHRMLLTIGALAACIITICGGVGIYKRICGYSAW